MAILMEKDYWLNSQLSIARFSGGIKLRGEEYYVMPQSGDLLMACFVEEYKALGREKFIEILKAHPTSSKNAMKVHLGAELHRQEEARKARKARKEENKELTLF